MEVEENINKQMLVRARVPNQSMSRHMILMVMASRISKANSTKSAIWLKNQIWTLIPVRRFWSIRRSGPSNSTNTSIHKTIMVRVMHAIVRRGRPTSSIRRLQVCQLLLNNTICRWYIQINRRLTSPWETQNKTLWETRTYSWTGLTNLKKTLPSCLTQPFKVRRRVIQARRWGRMRRMEIVIMGTIWSRRRRIAYPQNITKWVDSSI